MFDEQTDAFERLVCLGKLPKDHKQIKGYDYITDLKLELQKLDSETTKEKLDAGKPIGKHIGKRVGKAKPPIPPDVGKPISIGQLKSSQDDAEWIVDSFGARGALVLIAADVGTGKTTFLYSLASAIGKGESFLTDDSGKGQLSTKKKKVLFIQADETKNDCRRKCKIMGLDNDAFDFYFGEDGFETLDIPLLERLIAEGDYGVVMLDSVTTLLGNQGVSMKDPEFGQPLYELNKLASRKNILIFITSHLRKPEHQKRNGVSMFDILGAGTQAGAVSDIWALWRQESTSPGECKFILSCLEKARNCDAGTSWLIEGNIEDLSWTFKSVAANTEMMPSDKKDLKTYAEAYLCESKEWKSIDEVATYFHKNSEHTRRVLLDLFVEEKIERKNKKLGLEVGGRSKWMYRGK